MPQPNKIPLAFAASGDKNLIPESTETTGLASWREGFPAITSAPFSEGGIAPKRADFNGIFNALSQAVMWMQQGGVYAYDVSTDYEAGNVVYDAGGLYVANAANGPSSAVVQPSSDTTGAAWKLVRLDLATQSAAGYMSGADKTKLDALISTDATQTAAGYMSAADKNKLDALISTDATQTAAGYMSAADKTKLDALIVHNTLLPVGTVMWLSGNTVPDGCLVADGAAVSRTTYSELFAVIGTTWGEGDGSTTFNVPDMRNRFPEGAQTAGGYNAPGLPNVTGRTGAIPYINRADFEGSLFSFATGTVRATGNDFTSWFDIGIDASRSNSIYGASSTVQPASVKLLCVIVYRR